MPKSVMPYSIDQDSCVVQNLARKADLIEEEQTPQMRKLRYRALSYCSPRAAVHSEATTMAEVVKGVTELERSKSEMSRIDGDKENSMDTKKTEGYF